jgi:ABC-type multidrug transport system permease subunit
MNPAEHIVNVASENSSHDRHGNNWSQIWQQSPERSAVAHELDRLVSLAATTPQTIEDGFEFAMPVWEQCKIVTRRTNISLFRNTDYINNKVMLHITSALFNGFTFWKIGNAAGDLQLAMFTIFNFIFVAPGVMAQLQPLFIERRDLFEAREKKSKTYSWFAFVTSLIVSEIPYLCICAVLYFCCWYFTVGFPTDSNRAGATLFVMIMYEFIYTGIGQFVSVYAPNAVFAALTNPYFLGDLVLFCGVMVPYSQIQPFWRHWIYYLDPFNYLMGSLLVFGLWGKRVDCSMDEFAIFNPPDGLTCGEYLEEYQAGTGAGSNLVNPDATENCRVCPFTDGSDYLKGLNLLEYETGWRDAGIVVLFVFSSYFLVYALMKLRTKASKKPQ